MTASFYEHSGTARAALTLAIGAATVALQWAMQPWVGTRNPFLFFAPAILLTAMLLGRGPGLAVLVVGMVNGALLLPPVGDLRLELLPDRISMLAYIAVGMTLLMLGGRLRWITHRAADAEQRLRLVQENAGVGLFEIDLADRTIFVSDTLSGMFGRPPADANHGLLPLDEWNAPLRPEELKEARALLRKKLREGAESYTHEHRLILPDGQAHWFFTRIHIEKDGNGKARRLRGATFDITERKRIDELLASTENLLSQQVEDLHHLHELSSRLLELNDLTSQLQVILQALGAFLGAGKGLVVLHDPAQDRMKLAAGIGFSDAALEQLSQAVTAESASGQAYIGKHRVFIEDTETDSRFPAARNIGREQEFRAAHCTPLVNASGEVLGVMSVYFSGPHVPNERETRLSDICARKAVVFIERARAQATAMESDRRFRLVLDASAVPFNVLAPVRDAEGRIIDFRWNYVNLAAARELWRPVQELVGRRVQEVLPGSWNVPDVFSHFSAVADTGETREFELHSAPHGINGWYHVVASPLPGAVAVWFADVTERKQHEQALQEADRRKDEFLATLAHELRNPLAPIRQAALISKSPGATEAQKRWSHDVIERQVQHMSLLLEDLLDVSRITRGMLRLRKKSIELAAVIDAAVETSRPLIDSKQHELVIDLPPEPVHFEADQLRVAQVVSNLLTNAAKYTDPHGTIRLHCECVDDDLIISVTDNGIGIRRDVLNDIFNMFTQVRSEQDRSGGGLGIGLSLAKGLVELHGGTITASSAGPEKGSRFTVRLPMRAAEQPGTEAGIVVPPKFALARRILIADDNRDASETLAEFLRLQGHEVRAVYDGVAALEEFFTFRPDTVMLDIGMPGLTGNQVAQRIRESPTGYETMLVAITGWGQDKDKASALSAGFDHHLTKPIDLQRLNLLLLSGPAGKGAGMVRSANG
ncbi:MAG TPA: ATP-binding protein [Noviherbaspirillum sp.]|nr:ATP-binding protein [Noviherbaspirillum sp.]